MISAENGLCPQIEGRIQARTARLAGASVSEPIPKRGESTLVAAPACRLLPRQGFISPCPERPTSRQLRSGTQRDEHIGAVSIAPLLRDRGHSRMRRSVFGGSHRSVSEAPPQRDAGLTAPDVAFRTSSPNTIVD